MDSLAASDEWLFGGFALRAVRCGRVGGIGKWPLRTGRRLTGGWATLPSAQWGHSYFGCERLELPSSVRYVPDR